jgi:hypothetical protein
MKKQISSVKSLEELGRIRLSKSFFMRDFLFSDIANIHGLNNAPHDPDLAIAAGTQLCENLLEPLQDKFGRIAIRSSYRSPSVNQYGNENKLNCASNAANAAGHIWDMRDENGYMGATSCIVIPNFWDVFQEEGDWQKLAWWIHDHLPYSEIYFFPKLWAFNLTWHERPVRRIDSYIKPRGNLTKAGKDNHQGSHKVSWDGIEKAFQS